MRGRLPILFILLLFSRICMGQECAGSFSELGKTERLQSVRSLFVGDVWVGLVNETKGTYVTLISTNDKITLSLYTSGIFDLYPILKTGPVVFCDDGQSLSMETLGRKESVVISGGKLVIGKGGAKMSFTAGAMPEPLRKLHHLDVRGLASDH